MATVKHRKSDTIWLYEFPLFETFDDCPELQVWLSERDLQIILQGLQNIERFRTRVYYSQLDNIYETVTPEDFETFQGWVSDLFNHLGEYQMCNELMQDLIDQLAAIANKECCPAGGTGGSRGAGSTAQPPNPYDQEETPTEPPPGFEDMTEFNSHKCDAAEDLLNALKADLLGMSALSYASATPSGIAGILIGVLLTPVPFDDLGALAGYLIFTGYNYALLAQLSSVIGDNQDELRCALYDSPNVATATASLMDLLQEKAIAVFTLEADAVWSMGAVDWMLTTDAYNRLFVDAPTVSSGADCTECGECPGELDNVYDHCGSTSYDPGDTIAAVTSTTCGLSGTSTYRCYLRFNYDGDEFLGDPINPEVTIESGSDPDGGFTADLTPVPAWGYYNQDDTLIGQFEEQQVDLCCGYMLICSQSAFSVSVIKRL